MLDAECMHNAQLKDNAATPKTDNTLRRSEKRQLIMWAQQLCSLRRTRTPVRCNYQREELIFIGCPVIGSRHHYLLGIMAKWLRYSYICWYKESSADDRI
jgi:hypothetical protein